MVPWYVSTLLHITPPKEYRVQRVLCVVCVSVQLSVILFAQNFPLSLSSLKLFLSHSLDTYQRKISKNHVLCSTILNNYYSLSFFTLDKVWRGQTFTMDGGHHNPLYVGHHHNHHHHQQQVPQLGPLSLFSGSSCSSGHSSQTSSPDPSINYNDLTYIKKLFFEDTNLPVFKSRNRSNSGTIFGHRIDFSSFNVLPMSKINSYHIKMEDDLTHGSDDLRNFILSSLSTHKMSE